MGKFSFTHFFCVREKMELIEKIKEVVTPVLEQEGVELVDLIYRREAGNTVLRLLVDRVGGITLNNCTRLNEEIGSILDQADIMPERYLLEVNSPGLDRPLKTRRDFERVMGKSVHVHTYEPVNGLRDHVGIVRAIDDESVTIGDTEVSLDKISKAKLKV